MTYYEATITTVGTDAQAVISEYPAYPAVRFMRSDAPVTTTLSSDYDPDMVERLLRAKNGPFVTAPTGEAAFMKWLSHS